MDPDDPTLPEDTAPPADALTPVLSEALDKVFTALRHSTRKRVGDYARRGRGRMDEYQARKDLDRLYQKLGRETIRLIEAEELDHPALQNRLERIRRQEELVREAERQRAADKAALAQVAPEPTE